MTKKLLIAGATGFIGQALVVHLAKRYTISVLGRSISKLSQQFPNLTAYSWQNLQLEDIAAQHVVINLAGENIGGRRWSEHQRENIISSRVDTTTQLANFCVSLGQQAPRLLNASAIGVYGLATDDSVVFDEYSELPKQPSDFLSKVAYHWEQGLLPAVQAGVCVVKLRFGAVLAKQGGAMAKLLPSFRAGCGAILGNGQQPFSWVSLSDAIRAIDFLLDRPQLDGAFNVVADELVTQAAFAKALAVYLHRPCWLRLPAIVVKALFGQMGDELLLQGQKVTSTRLHQAGFKFEHDTLAKALRAIL